MNSTTITFDQLPNVEGGRKHTTAPSLADHANAMTTGMKRRPRGGYNI